MRISTLPLPLVLLCSVAPGCIHRATTPFDASEVAADEPAPNQGEAREIIVPNESLGEDASETASAPHAASVPLLSPDPVLFRLGAGYGALGQVDLSQCRPQGLQPGYVRMRVTFSRTGRVVRAALQSLAPQPGEALSCVGDLLEMAMVPVFDGDDVTLSRSFFVN
jgi:hypothetical protein